MGAEHSQEENKPIENIISLNHLLPLYPIKPSKNIYHIPNYDIIYLSISIGIIFIISIILLVNFLFKKLKFKQFKQ